VSVCLRGISDLESFLLKSTIFSRFNFETFSLSNFGNPEYCFRQYITQHAARALLYFEDFLQLRVLQFTLGQVPISDLGLLCFVLLVMICGEENVFPLVSIIFTYFGN
jgi:hypothetical protein